MFASQSHVGVISTRMVLALASKGALSINEYFTKMKVPTGEMASTGRKLEDEGLALHPHGIGS